LTLPEEAAENWIEITKEEVEKWKGATLQYQIIDKNKK
jgi:hypothetical protein